MNDPSGYCYGGPDSISQMMMNFAAQQIESIHVASFSLGGWRAGMIAHNLANRPRGSSQDRWIAATIAEKGLRFNEGKTAIVDRNGKVYATPSQGILAAASGGSTQAAGSSASGVSSNGALTDVLGGGVNEGSEIARDWSTEGSPVDYFTVSHVGGESGMDSSMSVTCALKCQIHAIIHGWGSKSTLSVNTVYYGIQAIDYAMMIGNPAKWATRGVVKTPVIGPIQIGVARGEMLGAKGTKIFSTTVWKGKGKERIDVENPNPGQRAGQIHYQDNKNNKYLYDPRTNSFPNAPKTVNEMLGNERFKSAIDKAMRYLGE